MDTITKEEFWNALAEPPEITEIFGIIDRHANRLWNENTGRELRKVWNDRFPNVDIQRVAIYKDIMFQEHVFRIKLDGRWYDRRFDLYDI